MAWSVGAGLEGKGVIVTGAAGGIGQAVTRAFDTTGARVMAVDLDHGASYGNTLTWAANDGSHLAARPVEIQFDLDTGKFYRMFTALMTRPTPGR